MSSVSGEGGRVSRRKEMYEKCSCCAEEVGKPRKVRPPHLWGTGCEEHGSLTCRNADGPSHAHFTELICLCSLHTGQGQLPKDRKQLNSQ